MKFKSILIAAIVVLSNVSQVSAQTNIISENFDGVLIPAMPANWVSTDVAGTMWRSDSTNSSSGYPSASGINNIVIRNTDPTGTYILTSPTYNASGFTNLSVTWAARVSTNFTASGSTTPIFEYSLDGGANWLALSYISNPANSVWAPENGGSDIVLPPTANGATNLKFRWTVTIVNNPNGTYRLDDFALHGNIVNAVNAYFISTNMTIYPNPSTGIMTFDVTNSTGLHQLSITDIVGNMIANMPAITCPFQWNGNALKPGIYLATITNENGIRYTKKFQVK
jgi:hypothetical protein